MCHEREHIPFFHCKNICNFFFYLQQYISSATTHPTKVFKKWNKQHDYNRNKEKENEVQRYRYWKDFKMKGAVVSCVFLMHAVFLYIERGNVKNILSNSNLVTMHLLFSISILCHNCFLCTDCKTCSALSEFRSVLGTISQ